LSILAAEIATSLEKESRKTLQFFNELEEADWGVQVYSGEGGWNVHHLLAHFTDVEGSIPRLIRGILDGGPGVPEDFDIDRWNARYTTEMAANDRQTLLAEFARRRAATVELARNITDADLETQGRHPFLGPSQVKDMLKLMPLHLQIHMRDIRRALRAGRGSL